MQITSDNLLLYNGIQMPALGFGTYQCTDLELLTTSLQSALSLGYRHIDTASFYGNEAIIGKALKESGIPREDLFITSKLWLNDHGYENALRAFQTSLRKLQTNYLDLYLIHWPQRLNTETWRALEKLYREGYVRAIGVSNFSILHLQDLMHAAKIVPMVNQIEFHPHLVNYELLEFCRTNHIQVEAWSPFMRGEIFKEALLKELAQKYKKTVAQIVLRWDLQMDVMTIPKSSSFNRLKENREIFNFEILPYDMQRIAQLNDSTRIGSDPDLVYSHPEIITT